MDDSEERGFLTIRRYQIAAGRNARGLVIIRMQTLLTHAC